MTPFAALLDRLAFQPSRNAKLHMMTEYFRQTPDPERGFALAALTGELSFRHAKPAMLRGLVTERMDEYLFGLSYDYVGDLAETISLVWPEAEGAAQAPPPLSHIVRTLEETGKAALPATVAQWLDSMTATERWALIKLITGSLRIGVSARLAKTAAAALKPVAPDDIEEIWPGLEPPYTDLFAWLTGEAEKPAPRLEAPFRPVMLAQPLDEAELDRMDPADFRAEWKWDGIRVQAVAEGLTRRLYSRTGEDISHVFPDVLAAMEFDAAIDGELIVLRGGKVAPFGDLQQRLNRKSVTPKIMSQYPAAVRAYDLLQADGEDLRPLSFDARRARLERFIAEKAPDRFDLSPLVPFTDWKELADRRAQPPDAAAEGVMLKRGDSVYVPGRPKGPWFKWKRDPFLVDAVLLYAQRGHGKRSSFYSDYTFGVWRNGTLVPVGKAYFGFTDEELKEIDKFVRNNTTNRFGPVREVTHTEDKGLVIEVAFEGLQRSARHKSGIAMRFPRVHRLRWDKPPHEADGIEALEKLLADIEAR